MSDLEDLFRELFAMQRAVIPGSEAGWRWVLSSSAVDLLRQMAAAQTGGPTPGGDATVLGIAFRTDDAAVHPMLELRR